MKVLCKISTVKNIWWWGS